MGTAPVIILPQDINRFPGMKNIAEPLLIQTLIAKVSWTKPEMAKNPS
jgi:hypothetical protein